MHGKIGVSSEYGKGSRFWFSLDLGLAHDNLAVKRQQIANELGGLHILVIDDSPTARVLMKRYLESFGFRVDQAGSGKSAFRLLHSHNDDPYDLVLTDWKMPEMNGIDIAQKLQTDESIDRPPAVLMVTAYDRQQLTEEAGGALIEGILVKPVSPSALLNAILAIFGKKLAIKEDLDKGLQIADSLRGARLLLVEDNEINRQVAQEILQTHGLQVAVAHNGQEALDLLDKDSRFDGVLMDVQMPVMDGHTATRRLREDERFSELPVIAMTANAFERDRKASLDAGMNDHVTKPIVIAELFATLERWVTSTHEIAGSTGTTDASDTGTAAPWYQYQRRFTQGRW